ncbi:E3 ubiquitin-protein ligase UPL3 [Striga hermonthica]|uniref:HECT-type E3 ubiquitin transferase n=1 Tax=Striga hermonthica TaxID=68872 RepID=A0A9N7MED2_STRHE|nr:E3 ubiquitin-protein ligase UPL3 [Striga hermonthica]
MEIRSRKRAEASTVPTSSAPTTRAAKRLRNASSSSAAAAAASSSTPMDSTSERSTASASAARGRRGKNPSNSKNSNHSSNKKRSDSKGNVNLDKGKEKEPEIRQGNSGRSLVSNTGSRGVADNGNDGASDPTVLEGLLRKISAEMSDIIAASSSTASQQSERLNRILSDLRAEGEESQQVEALMELTEVLSMATEASLRSFSYDSFVPVLVGLVNYESNPNIMLLAARALTHLVDVVPSSCGEVVRYGAVPCFVARLLSIEYMDLAEQSLQALKRISEEQPETCLRAGALVGVLSYLDFFPTGIQRVALSTAANICDGLPSDAADFVMEAVPTLTNLLQYHDKKVVEDASFCLTRVAEAFALSPERLDDLCSHGVVTQAAVLISSSSFLGGQASLGTHTFTDLIKLLSTLASGSALGAKSLHLLGIGGILKDLLLGTGQVTSISVSPAFGRTPEQVCEIVNLADELLPAVKGHAGNSILEDDSNGGIPEVSTREKLLNEQPELLLQFGIDLLPVLVQICNSSVNVSVRHKCLSVIRKILYFSTSEIIQSLIKVTNISSFLAVVLAWKDHQALVLALQIAEILMEKHPGTFSRTFVREGVVHAVDALILSGGDSSTSQQSRHKKSSNCSSRSRRNTRKDVSSSSVDNTSDPTANSSLLVTVSSHARLLKEKYFSSDAAASGSGVTDGLLRLKNLCTRMNMGIDEQKKRSKGKSKAIGARLSKKSSRIEEELVEMIVQLLQELSREEGASTFEFMSSGVVSCLLNYFTCGYFSSKKISKVGLLRLQPLAIRRYKSFVSLFLPSNVEGSPMSVLVQKLQNALSSLECFPLECSRSTYRSLDRNASVSSGSSSLSRSIKLRLSRAPGEKTLGDYSTNVVSISDPLTSLAAVEDFLLPRVQQDESNQPSACAGKSGSETTSAEEKDSSASKAKGKAVVTQDQEGVEGPQTRSAARRSSALDEDKHMIPLIEDTSSKVEESDNLPVATDEQMEGGDDDISDDDISDDDISDDDISDDDNYPDATYVDALRSATLPIIMTDIVHDIELGDSSDDSPDRQNERPNSSSSAGTIGRGVRGLIFTAEGRQLNSRMTVYQAVLGEGESSDGRQVWDAIHTILYQSADNHATSFSLGTLASTTESESSKASASGDYTELSLSSISLLDRFIRGEFPCDLEREDPIYNILALLRVLEGLNQYAPLLRVQIAIDSFAEGKISNLDELNMSGAKVSPKIFVNGKVTSKLTQKIQDTLADSTCPLPSWCYHLTKACPFLFPFETRCMYFYSTAFGFSRALHRLQQQQGVNGHGSMSGRNGRGSILTRQKVRVHRNRILDSAAKVMEMYSSQKAALEVEYYGEVGLGLGPTMEFYTLLSHEFQEAGLGMWRSSSYSGHMPLRLFPRPWPATADTSDGSQFSKVIEYFRLLGRIMAKALQDGRLLDLPLSAAFYRLVLGQELGLHDVTSFDAELGTTLQELQALACRKEYLESVRSYNPEELYFRGASVDDLCLDFSLPGYADYILISGDENVDISSLGNYVSRVVDATVGTGIMRQMEAFRSGFNQVFDISTLTIFSPNELDQLLCGCRELWKAESLVDHIKFDHGYTSNSPAIINLLEIMGEFTPEQQRAFCQFVTGAPRLPPGGLAVLNPKLTVVRKVHNLPDSVDDDLPSVMTCANYLKLPPYSSKEIMHKKLLYAISEGQGSFDLS